MKDILQRIAATKRTEVEAARLCTPLEMMRESALRHTSPTRSLRRSIQSRDCGIIAEFKRRSPSRGEISPMAQVADIVADYTRNGAAGCSILTDTPYFGGAVSDLQVARTVTDLPLLRKEFIIDEYQIYQTRTSGADAILLIASLLDAARVRRFTSVAHQLGMEVLLELHGEEELPMVFSDIDLVGVNNRNLRDFSVEFAPSLTLIEKLPAGCVKIAESGIRNSEDMLRLRKAGFDGFLIGEAFMGTASPGSTLASYVNARPCR